MPSYEVRNSKALGAALRHARTERGYTQDELAGQLDITRNYLNEMETGKPNLWSTRMFRALRFLKVRVSISFDGKADIPQGPDLNQIVVESLKNFDPGEIIAARLNAFDPNQVISVALKNLNSNSSQAIVDSLKQFDASKALADSLANIDFSKVLSEAVSNIDIGKAALDAVGNLKYDQIAIGQSAHSPLGRLAPARPRLKPLTTGTPRGATESE